MARAPWPATGKTRSPNTARSRRSPPTQPKLVLADRRTSTLGFCRRYVRPSRKLFAWALPGAKCAAASEGLRWDSLLRICRIRSAETRKEAELTTKAAGRPSKGVTAPPRGAPRARARDQVADERALAARISRGRTR